MSATSRRPLALTHPVALGALLLLLVNDHVLKRAMPGVLTGKLSDLAGMVFFPLVLVALARMTTPKHVWTARFEPRVLVAACLATAIGFALVKSTAFGNDAYRMTWGALQWPAHALSALARGRALPHLAKVSCVRDVTDLVALPFVGVAWSLGRPPRAASAPERPAPREAGERDSTMKQWLQARLAHSTVTGFPFHAVGLEAPSSRVQRSRAEGDASSVRRNEAPLVLAGSGSPRTPRRRMGPALGVLALSSATENVLPP